MLRHRATLRHFDVSTVLIAPVAALSCSNTISPQFPYLCSKYLSLSIYQASSFLSTTSSHLSPLSLTLVLLNTRTCTFPYKVYKRVGWGCWVRMGLEVMAEGGDHIVMGWRSSRCHHLHHCTVAMSLSLSWRCGTGHRCHIDIIFVVAPWPCHCHCHCCGAVAMSLLSLSLCCGHVAVVILVIIIIVP